MTVAMRFGSKYAREVLAELIARGQWWSKPLLAELMERSDKGIEVRVDIIKPKHTDSQRGFYHLCIDRLAKHIGMSHNALHDRVLIEWAGSEMKSLLGKTIEVPLRRSAKLGVQEYSELIETLARFFAFCDYPMPDPAEVAA